MKKLLFVPLLTLVTAFSFGFAELSLNIGGFVSSATEANAQQTCAAPLDIMFVLDASNSMSGGKLSSAKGATIDFLNSLNQIVAGGQHTTYAGVVSFRRNARLEHGLVKYYENATSVTNAISGIQMSSDTNIEAAIYLAQGELALKGRNDAKQIIILLSDGKPQAMGLPTGGVTDGWPDPYAPNYLYGTSGSTVTVAKTRTYAIGRASDAKNAGTIIYSVGFGNIDGNGGTPRATLQSISSGSGYLHHMNELTEAGLEAIYADIANEECDPVNPPTVNLTVNPTSVVSGSGDSVTLQWSSSYSTVCTASGDWSGVKQSSPGQLAQVFNETVGPINDLSTFTLTCEGPGGTASDEVTVPLTVNVPPPQPVPGSDAVDIKANSSDGPITIPYNTSANLTWNSTNGVTTCTATPAAGWSGSKEKFGNQSTGNLTSTQTYEIVCNSATGEVRNSVRVNVAAQTPAPTVTLTATPSSVTSGGSSTLSWTSTNATSCVASDGWSGPKATSGSESTGPLTNNRSYTIVCTGAGGTIGAATTVLVSPTPVPNPPTVDIKANSSDGPITISPNTSVRLSWSSQNTASCSGSAIPNYSSWSGSKSSNGFQDTSGLTQSYMFTITCQGVSGGNATDSVVVTVQAPVVVTSPYNIKIYRQDINGNLLSGTEARVVSYPNTPIAGVSNQTANPASFSVPSTADSSQLTWRVTYPPKRMVSYGSCSYVTGGAECNPTGFNEVHTLFNEGPTSGIYGGLLGYFDWNTYTRKVVARYADYDLEVVREDQNGVLISGTQARVDSRKIDGTGVDAIEVPGFSSANAFLSPRIPYRAGSTIFKQNAQFTDMTGQESWGVCTYNRGSASGCTPATFQNFPYALTPPANGGPYCNGSLCTLNVMNFAQDGKVLRVVVKYNPTPTLEDWDYALTADSMTIAAGGNAGRYVWKNLVSGVGLPVDLSVVSAPTGLTVTGITNDPCVPNCGSSVQVTAAQSMPVGNYTIRLKAVASGLPDKFIDMPVTVTSYVPPTATFNYSITGSSVVIPRGGTKNTSVTMTLQSGTTQSVTLSPYLPTSVPDDLTLNSITNNGCNPTCTSTLSITAHDDAILGYTYLIQLKAQTASGVGGAGISTKTVNVYVTIPTGAEEFDYVITTSPATIVPGGSGNGTFSISKVSGDTQGVTLTPILVPQGITINSVSNNPCSPECTGVVSVTGDSTVRPGLRYNIMFKGTSVNVPDKTVIMAVDVVEATPPPCVGPNCPDPNCPDPNNCPNPNCPDPNNCPEAPCEGVDCPDPNCPDPNNCPEECVGANCPPTECTGSNCPPEECEGVDCDEVPCTGPDCDNGGGNTCTGPDCDNGGGNTCTGPDCDGGNTNPIGDVACGVFDPATGEDLTNKTVYVNSLVTWKVISPINSDYTYSWTSASESALNNKTGVSRDVRHFTTGTKNATVTVSDGSGSKSCTINIVVKVKPIFEEV